MLMASLRKLLEAPTPADLAAIDPRSTPGLPKAARKAADPKAWSAAELATLGTELAGLQERMYASTRENGNQRLLIVLQAMDAGGKDGLVRHVGGAFNPLGLEVTSFKAPTKEELRHHFLWRIRNRLPESGHVGIFNRSHYEDVLIVRVHDLVPETEWRGRYDEINAFERDLVNDGVILVKIMLHISPTEQLARLRERLEDPTKFWKYNPADVDERARWDDYRVAYTEALTRCSEAAPWYVVPADRKWYRNWAVASLLVEILSAENPQYPPATFDLAAEKKRLG
ncbi:polyphosphate kinase 2 family protein [Virgisporangium ochraceum]|uniref:Polyphosphate kinase n=2 Tax=Virgisporangium ochraceum TaxID=65505 RepID=A0A8J4E8B7_9ACTN|nr:polyphosphate kinase [Virgisporangium ochraceum]